jgi:hypothetical protein
LELFAVFEGANFELVLGVFPLLSMVSGLPVGDCFAIISNPFCSRKRRPLVAGVAVWRLVCGSMLGGAALGTFAHLAVSSGFCDSAGGGFRSDDGLAENWICGEGIGDGLRRAGKTACFVGVGN